MMYENLEKYLNDYENTLKSRKYKALYARFASNLSTLNANLGEFVSDLREDDLMNDDFNNLSRSEKRSIANKMKTEIKRFYSKESPVKPTQSTATASINVLNEFLKRNPIKTLLSSSIVKYSGKKIDANALASPDFNPNNLSVRKPKELEVPEIKEAIDNFLKNPATKESLLNINDYVEDNFRKLISELSDLVKDNKILIQDVEILGDFDLNLKTIFNDRTLRNFDERSKTYDYWRGINGRIDNKLIPKLKELSVELGKTKSEEKALVDFKQFLDGDISDLNYVGKYDYATVGVKDLDVLAWELFSRYLTLIGGIMESTKNRSPTEAVRGFVRNANRTAVASGDQPQDEDYDEATGERLEDIANDRVKQFRNDMEKQPMDPLAIIYLDEVLEGVGTVSGNVVSLKNKMRKYFDDLYENNDKPNLEEDDAEAFFEDFLKKIENIDSEIDTNKMYLPLEMTTRESLEPYYKNLQDNASRSEDTINDFLRLFKSFIELNPITFDSNISLDMLGAGTGGKKLPKEQAGRWFNYSKYKTGKVGSLRTAFSGNDKEADKINENINKLINEISEILAQVFIAPQFTRHRVGTNLHFQGDATLRTVVAYKVSSPKFETVREINKRFIEQKFFLESEDIDEIIDFLEKLSGANAISQYSELYTAADNFADVLRDSFGNKESINKQINKDVASILGSVYRYVSKEYKDKYPDLDEFEGIDVSKSFDSRKTDDPLDMYPVQAFTELLRSRGKNIPFRTETSQGESFYNAKDNKGVTRMLGLMDRLVKSDFQQKQLEAHDAIRILKSQPIHYALKRLNDFDHVNDMIEKMEKEHSIDMSASEIISIVNKLDSYEGIANDYGISSEHVYVLKANFR